MEIGREGQRDADRVPSLLRPGGVRFRAVRKPEGRRNLRLQAERGGGVLPPQSSQRLLIHRASSLGQRFLGAGGVELQARRTRKALQFPSGTQPGSRGQKQAVSRGFVGVESLQPLTLWLPSSFSLPGAGVRRQPACQVGTGLRHHGPLSNPGQRQHHRAPAAALPGPAEG